MMLLLPDKNLVQKKNSVKLMSEKHSVNEESEIIANSHFFVMEEVMSIFLHLADAVFDSLTMKVSKIANKSADHGAITYLDEQKFFQIRSIQATVFHELGDTWKQVFKLLDTPTITELKCCQKGVLTFTFTL